MAMHELLRMLLSLSLSGTMLGLILFAGNRLLRNKLPQAFSYYIWLLVLLRLTVPLALPINAMDALFGAAPDNAQAIQAPPSTVVPSEDTGAWADRPAVAPPVSQAITPGEALSPAGQPNISPARSPITWAAIWTVLEKALPYIWAAGALIAFSRVAVSYILFARKVLATSIPPHPEDAALFYALRKSDRVQLVCSAHTAAPMLLGVLRPRIVIPALAYRQNGMEVDLQNILRHELIHYARKDLLYKWLVVLVTSIHWFNPFMLLIKREIAHACELACDEAVTAHMTMDERRQYGSTLLVLSSSNGFPTGTPAAPLHEDKENLKERLINIMQNKRKTLWTALLCAALAAALAGCGAAIGAVAPDMQAESATPTPVATPKATAGMPPANTSASASASTSTPTPTAYSTPIPTPLPEEETILYRTDLNLDGDGRPDTISVIKQGERTTVTLSMGDGSQISDTYILPVAVYVVDLTGDGMDEFVFSSGPLVRVANVKDGQLVELPSTITPNSDLPYDQKDLSNLHDETNVTHTSGATIVERDGLTLLRVRMHYMGDDFAAWYIDLLWNGDGWDVHAMEIGDGFQEEFSYYPIVRSSVALEQMATLPTVHRDGFQMPEITFFVTPEEEEAYFDHYGPADDCYMNHLPDVRTYMEDRMMYSLTGNELAVVALRQLYDMTGYQPKQCFARFTRIEYGPSYKNLYNILFFLTEDGIETPFFSVCIDWCTGYISKMDLVWKQQGTEYSPLESASCVLPESFAAMSEAEVAQWYYENSAYGDRCAIVSAQSKGNGLVRLFIEDGSYYQVLMQAGTGLPSEFYGPFPPGSAF